MPWEPIKRPGQFHCDPTRKRFYDFFVRIRFRRSSVRSGIVSPLSEKSRFGIGKPPCRARDHEKTGTSGFDPTRTAHSSNALSGQHPPWPFRHMHGRVRNQRVCLLGFGRICSTSDSNQRSFLPNEPNKANTSLPWRTLRGRDPPRTSPLPPSTHRQAGAPFVGESGNVGLIPP